VELEKFLPHRILRPPSPVQIADGSSASPLRIFALASIAFLFFFAKLQNQGELLADSCGLNFTN
jgi:hypothetical protein